MQFWNNYNASFIDISSKIGDFVFVISCILLKVLEVNKTAFIYFEIIDNCFMIFDKSFDHCKADDDKTTS